MENPIKMDDLGFIMVPNPIKMDDLGGFTPIFGNNLIGNFSLNRTEERS